MSLHMDVCKDIYMEIPTHICKYCSLEQVVSNTDEFPLSFLLFLLAAHCYRLFFGLFSFFLFFRPILTYVKRTSHIFVKKNDLYRIFLSFTRVQPFRNICVVTSCVKRWRCTSKDNVVCQKSRKDCIINVHLPCLEKWPSFTVYVKRAVHIR